MFLTLIYCSVSFSNFIYLSYYLLQTVLRFLSLITFDLVRYVSHFVDVECKLLRLYENFKVLLKLCRPALSNIV